MKRTPLSARTLPSYTPGEEYMNMVTHIVGGALGIAALVLCLVRASLYRNSWGIAASAVYGASMILTFAISSIYHGLHASLGKKVMQVIDHCTIYLLIAGTYTVILLSSLRPRYPLLSWGLFAFEWTLAAAAAALTAIDLKKYSIFSMVCYIGMGWAILPFWRQTLAVLTPPGFWLLLSGGIAYTVGAVLYGLGSRRKWMHGLFHIFVDLGAALHFLCIFGYGL